MKPQKIATLIVTAGIAALGVVCMIGRVSGQSPVARLEVSKGAEQPAIAIADMRGTGDAQKFMDAFNSTLWDEVSNAGVLKMVSKSVYRLASPAASAGLSAAGGDESRAARANSPQTVKNGPWLTDWSWSADKR